MRNHDTKRVLVVDDEESILTFAQQVFSRAGYDVAVATDAAEALRLVEAESAFDLFVLDVVMPRMSGDELARQLRRRDPDARILYFTGHSDWLFSKRHALWNNEAFLEKPVSVNGLLEAASLLLYGRLSGSESTA